MPIVQFQICFIFSFCSFAVHHIPVKDRHGMVPAGKFRPSGQHSGLFPLPQPGLIRRYTSKRMLDRGPAEVRRHLRKTKVKIKPGCVFLRHVYHMLCGIKTLFCLRDLPQFFPDLCVDLCHRRCSVIHHWASSDACSAPAVITSSSPTNSSTPFPRPTPSASAP